MKHDELPDSMIATGAQTLNDISGQCRHIRGIFAPHSAHDVCEIVRWARKSGGVRLHPVSCGNNWGFGSNLPAEDGAYLLDLSRLKSIRQLATDRHFVEIEPGVTQGMLDSALRAEGRTHYFNVTGAGTDASVVGNALERGIGYFGMRHEDILDLEVVLPTGETIQTGFHPENPFHSGLGSDLANLFFQSALGIVTAVRIRLYKRPECMGGLLIKPHSSTPIETIVELLSDLKAENLIRSVPHVGNKQRAYVTFAPFVPAGQRQRLSESLTDWTAVVPVSGSKSTVEALKEHISGRIGGVAECELIVKRDAKRGVWMDSLLDLCQGIPSNIALPGVAFAALGTVVPDNTQPEEGEAGLIHVVPTCPPQREQLQRLLCLVEDVRTKHLIPELPMTINLANVGMAVVVISVPFSRRDEHSRAKALRFTEELKRSCIDHGFPPYRLGIGDSKCVPPTSGKRQIIVAIQKAVDPQQVLCRSKYAEASVQSAHRGNFPPSIHAPANNTPEIVAV